MVSPDSGKQTILVKLDLGNTELKYSPGDHLSVIPKNSPQIVTEMASLLNVDLNDSFTLNGSGKTSSYPIDCSIGSALYSYIDFALHHYNRRQLVTLLQYLIQNTQLRKEKRSLLRFYLSIQHHTKGASVQQYLLNKYVTILDILKHYKSTITFEQLLTISPIMKPRFYSIASSLSVHQKEVHLCVSVVNEVHTNGLLIEGVCSNFLSRCNKGDLVQAQVHPTCFKLKQNNPIIMVGAGSGIAPFRGFWEEANSNGHDKPLVLYFGCRNEQDFLFQGEIKALSLDIQVHNAFSRRPGLPKTYVQDKIYETFGGPWELILEGAGYLYICGDAKMAQGVMEALRKRLQRERKWDVEQAKNYLDTLENNGFILQDVWGHT
uniref:NADPH--hemoprotein reductase n=1 Tax=Arcella intermedia TaxID=1963864 RepID=A0A6B2L704_9EUKA